MPELSISEIVKRYGISDKTVRNWINAGRLKARKSIVAGHETYFVEVEEIERVLRERGIFQNVPASSSTDNDQRITALEQRVSTLEDLVYALQEARARTEHPSGPPTPPLAKMAPEREKRPYTHKRENQPPDTITMAHLAKKLNITPRTLQEHVMKRNFDHIAIFKRKRGDIEEYERYFTEEQAEYVKAWHAQIKKS